MPKHSILVARYAWGFLGFTILVITWGALVRATGSGAGCGDHWPLCNGLWVPVHPQLATLIELTHRAMSGLSLIGVIVLAGAAYRYYPRQSPVRWAAYASLAFMLSEALIGAGLVLLRLVAQDTSGLRAVYLSIHLVNTFLLLAALTSTAWWATHENEQGSSSRDVLWLSLGGLGLLIVGISGGIAALGDTLFPSSSLAQGFAQDLNPATHFLIKLRVLHPVFAMGIGFYLIVLSGRTINSGRRETRACAWAVMLFVLMQWGIGSLNLMWLAPVALQLVHLAVADGLWISWVLLSWNVWVERPIDATLARSML